MTKRWVFKIEECPLNKRIHFLCRLGGQLYEIVGTLTTNPYNGTIIRGECIDGDPEIFYRAAIEAWAVYEQDWRSIK